MSQEVVTLDEQMTGWYAPLDEGPVLNVAHFFRARKHRPSSGSFCKVIQFLGQTIRATPYRGLKSPLDATAEGVCATCRLLLLTERKVEELRQAEREEHERMLNSTKETA